MLIGWLASYSASKAVESIGMSAFNHMVMDLADSPEDLANIVRKQTNTPGNVLNRTYGDIIGSYFGDMTGIPFAGSVTGFVAGKLTETEGKRNHTSEMYDRQLQSMVGNNSKLSSHINRDEIIGRSLDSYVDTRDASRRMAFNTDPVGSFYKDTAFNIRVFGDVPYDDYKGYLKWKEEGFQFSRQCDELFAKEAYELSVQQDRLQNGEINDKEYEAAKDDIEKKYLRENDKLYGIDTDHTEENEESEDESNSKSWNYEMSESDMQSALALKESTEAFNNRVADIEKEYQEAISDKKLDDVKRDEIRKEYSQKMQDASEEYGKQYNSIVKGEESSQSQGVSDAESGQNHSGDGRTNVEKDDSQPKEKRQTLPSDEKGTWSGERGNSYFLPNDDYLKNECKNHGSFYVNESGEKIPGIPFDNGKVQFNDFACTMGGHQLIGDIPFPTQYRTTSPVGKKYDSVEKKNLEGGGFIHGEFDDSLKQSSKIVVNGVNNSEVLMREGAALGGRKSSIQTMSSASNYNQALASVSYSTGISQTDLRYMMNISGKPETEASMARLEEISERSGYSMSELQQLTSRELTIHEQLYVGEDGMVHACGIIMPRDIHEMVHHGGAVEETKDEPLAKEQVKDRDTEEKTNTNSNEPAPSNDKTPEKAEDYDELTDSESEGQTDGHDLDLDEDDSEEESEDHDLDMDDEESEDQEQQDSLSQIDDESDTEAEGLSGSDDADKSENDVNMQIEEENETQSSDEEQGKNQSENESESDEESNAEGQSQSDSQSEDQTKAEDHSETQADVNTEGQDESKTQSQNQSEEETQSESNENSNAQGQDETESQSDDDSEIQFDTEGDSQPQSSESNEQSYESNEESSESQSQGASQSM